MLPIRSARGRARSLALLLWATLSAFAAFALAPSPAPAAAFEPWWVQNHVETELWSGPDSRAESFGRVPQWSYFLVSAPQQGPRLYVFNPLSRDYAYIDASSVGPSAPPSASTSVVAQRLAYPEDVARSPTASPLRKSPSLPPGLEAWWVANFLETELWSGPAEGAASLGTVPQFRRFLVMEPQSGDRLRVWSPEEDRFGFLDAAVVGTTGTSVWMSATLPRVTGQIHQPARAFGIKTYARNLPIYDDETELRYLPSNTAIFVRESAVAADGTEWYTLTDGEYVLASQVKLPPPIASAFPGRWIDVDLNEPVMVTAYEGDRAVYSALAIKGTVAFSTPTGTFYIQRRVENETMNSETLPRPIPRNAPGGYYLKDVLYTQYFTPDGASLHYNWWLGTFGYAGSHGCLGLNQEDSRWFWDWATIGTPVVIR